MNFLFARKYKYTVSQPCEDVVRNFLKVTKRKWWNFSDNITGRLKKDGRFEFTHKWSPIYIRSLFGNNVATIKGCIIDNGPNTVIEMTLKPNLGVVFFIYIIAVIFLCELFGVKTFERVPRTFILSFFPFAGFLLYGIIMFMTSRLRDTFERVFYLHADQNVL